MSVWVCPDSETAEDKRQELNGPLTFNPEELALILRWVLEDRSSLGVLMQAKKIFGGSFFEN